MGDVEDAVEQLIVTAQSSAPEILPLQSIILSGVGSNRLVRIMQPSANAFGSVSVTLTVTDTPKGDSATTFQVNIAGVNNRPTFDANQ